MKKVCQRNGYIVYEATSIRDTNKYGLAVGEFNIYMKDEIEAYGLTMAYPEYEAIDSLKVVKELIEN